MRVQFLRLFGSPSLAVSALFFAALVAVGGVAGQALAQEELSKNGAWTAFTYKEGGKLTCYMYAQPTKQEGNYTKRSAPNAMITRRRGSVVVEEVSVTSGYPYKDGSPISLQIDGRGFKFGIIQDEHAWANNADEDKVAVQAMIRGSNLTVRGTSRKDSYSLDTYSLKGFSKTHKAIVKACP
ncbi:MAG: invasion associated locus B family protein [Proteobacteria bacterium]|nr:invasion associated locus B family protein [Pseudomonadota bacterium]MDA1355705.1 invasion associated locus B family protein [Pseudomonadota bacterium]